MEYFKVLRTFFYLSLCSLIAIGTHNLLYLVVLIFRCRILPLDQLLLKNGGLSHLVFDLSFLN